MHCNFHCTLPSNNAFSVGDLMGRALKNLASLLAMPYGCGEQNMLLFAPNIFILQYLESTNQLTPAIRATAETYLVTGENVCKGSQSS